MVGTGELRDQLNALTPRLRRYARALATGSPAPSAFADDLVHAALMRALHGKAAKGAGRAADGDLAPQLYATLTQLHRDAGAIGQSAVAGGAARPELARGPSLLDAPILPARQNRMSAGLLSLPLECREALLLVALEGFDHAEAARILRVSRGVLVSRLGQARTALDAFLQAGPAARQPAGKAAAGKPAGRDVPYLRVVS